MSILRITVAGKGGTGKTVVAAALSRTLARRGRRVLAVDCDSNPMLGISLGVPAQRAEAPSPIPVDFWRAVERLGTGRAAVLVEPPDLLLARHTVAAPDGVVLLDGPVVENGGCTSDAGVRAMLGAMLGAHLFDRVVTDFEAGVDEPAWALGGLHNPADVLLVVATPSPVAQVTAARIAAIAHEAGVERVYGIANQVRSDAERAAVTSTLDACGLPCAAVLPLDEAVAIADRRGGSPLDAGGDSTAVDELRRLAERLDREV